MSERFHSDAVAKIERYLDKARKALFTGRSARAKDDFITAWEDFLLAAGVVEDSLQQGSQASGRARQWHGGWKRSLKGDDLVLYFQQSRDVVQHRIENVAKLQQPFVTIGGPGERTRITSIRTRDLWASEPVEYLKGRAIDAGTGRAATVTVEQGGPKLMPITNRGRTYQPPREHMGKPLTSDDPLELGALYVRILESALGQAKSL